MSKYIDADTLLKSAVSKFKCVPSVGVIYFGNGEEIFDGEDLQDFIRAMPTADVVEVVRCKDCKYFTKERIADTIECICKNGGGMINISPDSFCSYGERIE